MTDKRSNVSDGRTSFDITDMVHSAEYQFQVVMGNLYWLAWDCRKEKMLLVQTGPDDWTTGAPVDYEYVSQVKYMGDHTWLEVKENENGN